MKLSLYLFVVFTSPTAVATQGIEHVRPLDPWATEALELGLAGSALMRELVAALDASDVIVHIETKALLPSYAAGTTRLGGATASYRYVRIVVNRDMLPVARAAVLGHELQHAREIAQSQADDTRGMYALYSAIGQRVPGEGITFETEAAANAGMTVWFELHGDAKRAGQFAVRSHVDDGQDCHNADQQDPGEGDSATAQSHPREQDLPSSRSPQAFRQLHRPRGRCRPGR